jgi:signal peptidase II
MPQRSYRLLMYVLVLIGLSADQATKYGMFNGLYEEGKAVGSRDVIPGVFKFLVQYDNTEEPDNVLARWNAPVPPRVNHGALFSLGGEYKTNANRFFAVVSLIAAVGIIVWSFRKSTREDKWLCVALGLILGGTLGNLFDRVVFGGVRDFLYFYLIEWPVFNVADCCLVCGAGLLLVMSFFSSNKKPNMLTAVPVAQPHVA